MKSEALKLAVSLDEAMAMNVAHVLNGINGVTKVAISTAGATVAIDFDENATSVQELRTALHQAGFGVKKAAHADAGMCCGSCGG